MSNYVSLQAVLGMDDAELSSVKQGEFETTKLGVIPYTALNFPEYKQAKKDCFTMTPNGTGGMVPDLDDDKLMVNVIVTAVDKDTRNTFTFANKELLKKLKVVSANDAVSKLLLPGEVVNMAMAIQRLSGFGPQAEKDKADEIKND